jgi:hypothetical protein
VSFPDHAVGSVSWCGRDHDRGRGWILVCRCSTVPLDSTAGDFTEGACYLVGYTLSARRMIRQDEHHSASGSEAQITAADVERAKGAARRGNAASASTPRRKQ